MKYVIRINTPLGAEEYDGGDTLAEARKEAATFVPFVPQVKICVLKGDQSDLRPYLVEMFPR